MTIKNAVYGGLSFFLLIIIVLLVFKGQQKPEIEKTASDLFPTPISKTQPVIPQILRAEPPPAPSFSSLFEETLLKPAFLESVLEIRELIRPIKKEAVFSPLIKPTATDIEDVSRKKISSPVGLTFEQEREIFDKLYPDYFREGLLSIQEVFVSQKFFPPDYKKIEEIKSEEDIFYLIDSTLNVFGAQGFISDDEVQKLRHEAFATWKSILESEKKDLMNQKLLKSSSVKKIFALNKFNEERHFSTLILNIFSKIRDVFFSRAFAQNPAPTAPGHGYGFSGGKVKILDYCWKVGPPLPAGANIWAPCCDCGFIISKKGKLIFIEHCGPSGEDYTACPIPLGCLNLFAIGLRPAIWDAMTGICGVG